MQMTLAEITGALDGRLLDPAAAGLVCDGVSTDSRTLQPGQLFVALHGEQFDGHGFVERARIQGAAAALVADESVARVREGLGGDLPLIAVADTRLALGRLAAAWRQRFTLPVIAVTGSNGKTTTKEMIAAILAAAHGEAAVLATRGNLNNDIGLPMTLLGLGPAHRAAVVEMGMNHPGEIAWLTGLARPDVALVTNAQRAHLLGMGSLTAIAEEKGAIYGGLGADGVAVINADDPHAALWRAANAGRRIVSFGLGKAADVRGRIQVHGLDTRLEVETPAGGFIVQLALPGVHNARNALAAVATTVATGVTLSAVRDGLAAFRGVRGRLQRRDGRHGALLLDDTYNANPDSVRAGIDVLAATVGRKILVLGDMGEIGEASGQFHDEIGGYAKSAGIDRLFALGEASAIAARNFGEGASHFKRVEDLVTALGGELDARTVVLVKGSRFMRMERVVEALLASPSAAGVAEAASCS